MGAGIARVWLQRVWREPEEAITRRRADLEVGGPNCPSMFELSAHARSPSALRLWAAGLLHLAATLVETYLMDQDRHDVEPERERQVAESLARQLSVDVGRTQRVLEPSQSQFEFTGVGRIEGEAGWLAQGSTRLRAPLCSPHAR